MNKEKKAADKKKLRAKYLAKRDGLDLKKRRIASEKIKAKAFETKQFTNAETVFVYASYKSEVETMELIKGALRRGKRVAVPKVDGIEMEFYEITSWEELFPGFSGILEPQIHDKMPVTPKDSDVFLIPGAAFDLAGRRIGYGGGYYDRYWNRINSTYGITPCFMALAFEAQICRGGVPAEKHDKKMDCIITERRVIMPKNDDYGKWDIIIDIAEGVIELVLELID